MSHQSRFLVENEKEQFRKFFENLQQLSINIPFVEALDQMPKYAMFMKDLLINKAKFEETSKVTLNERCSAVLLNEIPLKEKVPRSFTIPLLDMEEDFIILIILGRPFLATAHAIIDYFNKKISFELGDEKITFYIEKSMKFSPSCDDICHSFDMVDLSIHDHVQETLPKDQLDSFLFEPIKDCRPSKDINL
ncbi:hypothetical protein Tco_0897531 [Tanacetum coccineum]